MIHVTYITAEGDKTTVEAKEGDNVMSIAIANGIDGIIGECGGSMMCATCHCYVDKDWTEATGERMDGEDDMLECASSEVKPTSRLSCQIKLTAEHDGLVIHMPEDQL